MLPRQSLPCRVVSRSRLEGEWQISRGSSRLCVVSLVYTHCITAVHSQRGRMKKRALAQKPGGLRVWLGSATQCVT